MNAFIKNYNEIFWPAMDITKKEVDEMLGVVKGLGIITENKAGH